MTDPDMRPFIIAVMLVSVTMFAGCTLPRDDHRDYTISFNIENSTLLTEFDNKVNGKTYHYNVSVPKYTTVLDIELNWTTNIPEPPPKEYPNFTYTLKITPNATSIVCEPGNKAINHTNRTTGLGRLSAVCYLNPVPATTHIKARNSEDAAAQIETVYHGTVGKGTWHLELDMSPRRPSDARSFTNWTLNVESAQYEYHFYAPK